MIFRYLIIDPGVKIDFKGQYDSTISSQIWNENNKIDLGNGIYSYKMGKVVVQAKNRDCTPSEISVDLIFRRKKNKFKYMHCMKVNSIGQTVVAKLFP